MAALQCARAAPLLQCLHPCIHLHAMVADTSAEALFFCQSLKWIMLPAASKRGATIERMITKSRGTILARP